MTKPVERYQAEAYELYDLARQLYHSGHEQDDLAKIEDKDAAIVGMSKMIINMMEILKVENLKPAIVKRAHALREAGPDMNMKRILPQAVCQITKSINEGHYKRLERDRTRSTGVEPQSKQNDTSSDKTSSIIDRFNSADNASGSGICQRSVKAQRTATRSKRTAATTPVPLPEDNSNVNKRSPTYWQDWLAGLELADDKDTGEGSGVGTNGSKGNVDGVSEETTHVGDLIEL